MANYLGSCSAFLVSDQVITDKRSGKSSLIGVFNRLNCTTFPAVHASMSIWARFAGVEGYQVIRVELRDDKDKMIASMGPVEARFPKRLSNFEFFLDAQMLQFERRGRYQFQLYVNDELKATTSLEVEPVGAGQSGYDQDEEGS